MERTLLVLAVLFGMSSAVLPPVKLVKEPIADQYIVVFNKTADMKADTLAISDISGVKILRQYKHILKGVGVRLRNPEALKLIQKVRDVVYIEQDGKVTKQGKDMAMTWGLDRVNQRKLPLDGKSNFTGDGQGVNVYVIDTGIYPSHEYFGGRARIAFDAYSDGQMGLDCNGHGTHCAGTIGGEYYGIARAANLWGVRVLDCYGSGSYSGVLAGMEYVAAHHLAPAVASMSLGGGASDALDDAVRGMYDAGVPVSVAAGNSNYDACYSSPARAPLAITVGATDHKDYRAYFSNYGSCLDIFAPGVDVLSTMIGSPTATATYSGTSMACPHVSGAIALLLGNHPTLTPQEVEQKLLERATSGVIQDTKLLSPDKFLYIP